MIYVTSDLHGIALDDFKDLLHKAGFGKRHEDFLFVLGDVIDRGEYGIDLLRWIFEQPNVQLILGNHEAMMIACRWVCDEITEESAKALTAEQTDALSEWMENGGQLTLRALRELTESQDEDDREAAGYLFEELLECPLYDTVSVGDRDFILTHSGLGNFRPDKKLSEYTVDDLLWNRPSPNDRYFDNAVTVFGHTPTAALQGAVPGKIYVTDTWIDIDIGVADNYPPMVLRLDDMKEFYL